ncbi:MAG: FAD binding domain-containing protein [Candidatus Binatia bacterium]
MKPPSFDYAAPNTVGEAVAMLQQHAGDAKILAGGQSLMPLLNMRLARPALLVDVARIDGLDYIRDAEGSLAIGAMTRQRSVEHSDLVKRRFPLVHTATLHVAHPQNRNQGTVGGSLAHADPAAEYPAVALALDAEFRAVGPAGERCINAADFFLTYLTTALEPAEVLTEVRFPALPPRTGWAFTEVARRHGDFALAGVVAWVACDGGGRCSAARIVLFGVGATPVRVRATEQLLVGEQLSERLFDHAGRKASAEIDAPLSDVHASTEYRRALASVLTRRTLAEATTRARAAV